MDNLNFEFIKRLEHGTNKQQVASLNKTGDIVDYETQYELTYNDIFGLTTAVSIISEFFDVKAVAIAKTSQVTGVALGADLSDAWIKAVDCNPVDSLSGVIAFSSILDKKAAMQLNSGHLVVAPGYEDDAIEVLEKNSIRYVKLNTPLEEFKEFFSEDVKITPFGTLVQEANKTDLSKDNFKVVTKTKPTVEQIQDAIFAWKIAKYIKSNAIVVAKDFKTTAISQGLESQSMEFAMDYACDTPKESVVASDLPITISDLNALIQNRVSLLIVPGVTENIIKQADKCDTAIITTGFCTSLN